MAQPYGYLPVPTSNPGILEVTIPSGIQPGQSFEIIAGSQKMKVTCPPGHYPGMKLSVMPPPPPGQQPAPLSVQPPPPQPSSPGTLLDVQIPPGCMPGMTFEVIYNSQKIGVQCPPNCSPGQTIRVQVPGAAPSPTSYPSASPAGPMVQMVSQSPPTSYAPAPSPSAQFAPPPSFAPAPMMMPVNPSPRSYQVAIPPGFIIGQPFAVTVGGRPTMVMCPPNARLGKIIEVIV